MRFALSVAALAGAAIAAPNAVYHEEKPADYDVVVEWTTVVKTVYVTEGYAAPTETPSAYPVYPETPEVITSVYHEAPAPTSKVEEYKPVYTPAPEPAYTPTPAPAKPQTPSNGYMGVVDEYRSKMGMQPITCDEKLEANAMDTVVASNGAMVHKLNKGTYGQVLAPGGEDDFKHVYVGGWLCEMPYLPGLDGECAEQSNGWDYAGQTGHAEILSNPQYTKIGCALHKGIWACDLGY